MKRDCKSVIRGFESHLGLDDNTAFTADLPQTAKTCDSGKPPDKTLTGGVSGCVSGCGEIRRSNTLTYLIQCNSSRRIKIGRTADFDARLACLVANCPTTLSVLGIMGGDFERELHKQFADARDHGEWFYPAPAILKLTDRRPRKYNWLPVGSTKLAAQSAATKEGA